MRDTKGDEPGLIQPNLENATSGFMKNIHDKILAIVNLLLIIASGSCIYYLATANYVKPAELAEAKRFIDDPGRTVPVTDTSHHPIVTAPVPQDTPAPKDYPNLARNVFQPFFTPTPTPTPPPTATPEPPDLNTATFSWQIRALDEGKATFEDPRTNDVFDMTVGGPPHVAKDGKDREVQVQLISVDTNEAKVVLGFQGQTAPKNW